MNTRRKFLQSGVRLTALGGISSIGGMGLAGSLLSGCDVSNTRDTYLNIMCRQGCNSERILGPFRARSIGTTINTYVSSSDLKLINALKESMKNNKTTWDLITVNQQWTRDVLFKENLIRPINKDRFYKYYKLMLPHFNGPYPYALDKTKQELLGMVQRFGSCNYVINTNKISSKSASRVGYRLFLERKMRRKYGIYLNESWNIIHCALAGNIDMRQPMDDESLQIFMKVTDQIFSNSRIITNSIKNLNDGIVGGDLWGYFSGGIHTAAIARINGHKQIRAITPNSGPIDGKGGVFWAEVTSVVNNPNTSNLAQEYLEYLQQPEIAKIVAFGSESHNLVAQMANPEVLSLFSRDELSALQWEDLNNDINRSFEYPLIPDYNKLLTIYENIKNKYVQQ